jgi:large subunit ribosomal protein L25
MKSVELIASKRNDLGSKSSALLRKENKIPGVLYGGKENIHFIADVLPFEKIINSAEVTFVDLKIDATSTKAIIKEVQFHPVTDRIAHIDLLEVNFEKLVTIGVPVKTKGASKGVLAGGKLIQKLRKVIVRALPKNIPEFIEIDITDIGIGQSVKVSDLKFDGVEFLDAQNSVVLAVKVTRAVAPTETAAAPAAAAPAAAKAAPAAKK